MIITNSGLVRLNYTPSYCVPNFSGECCSSFAVNQKYRPHSISTYRSNSMFDLDRSCMKLDTRSCLLRCYSSETNEGTVGNNVDKNNGDAQAPIGEQDQTRKVDEEIPSPISTRGSMFRNEFLRRIIPWEEINDSLDTFPYYIDEQFKTHLVECVASRLKHKQLAKDFGGRLASSSRTILLQSHNFAGTLLYRDKLVRAIARELQVPLLVLDGSVLPPYYLSKDCSYIGEIDEDSDEDKYESYLDSDSDEDESDKEKDSSRDKEPNRMLKKGDRVKYVGPTTTIEANNRTVSKGQRGEVHEVNEDKVAVAFYTNKSSETASQPSLSWFDVKHIKHDSDARIHDCYAALEVLCGVLESQQPLILYFPDSFTWLPSTAQWNIRHSFARKVKEMFGQLTGRVVLICGEDNWNREANRIFTNAMHIKPPEDEDLMKTFREQIEEDKQRVISRSNFNEIHKVLKKHDLVCMDLEQLNTNGVTLTEEKAEKIIGWATNHHLSSCLVPCVKGEQLHVPLESLKLAISRLMKEETESGKRSKNLESFASGQHERAFVSAVVHPDDIGVKFEDVGALEHVKKALHELVILPMTRPELFSHGNLLRPCKGLLLFGPPGTGKTLIAKALATEAKANFMNITAASLTSMWYGEAEKYTKALFTLARKIAPVIIFIDEIESLLGARGSGNEHEATRRLRNEFMSSWDGLLSKESQRILIVGATNRPFDLDDAIIRRMPRRILVDLPDVENREKILRVLLAKENLESGFSFEQLAKATLSYSGSDLKNLCVAAAYRPVEELLEEESKGNKSDGVSSLRPLQLDDFIRAKAKVGPSVAYNAKSMIDLRVWNEQYGEGGRNTKEKKIAINELMTIEDI